MNEGAHPSALSALAGDGCSRSRLIRRCALTRDNHQQKAVGTAGTSKVVYVGAPAENILMTAANNSAADLFHGILVYLGVKAS